MAAYAALSSLAQTTDRNGNPNIYLLSSDAKEKIGSIHEFVLVLLSFFDNFPEKVNRWEGRIRDVARRIEGVINLLTWLEMELSYGRMYSSIVELEDQLNDAPEEIGLIAGAVMGDSPAAANSSSSTLAPAATSSSSRLAPIGNDVVIGLQKDLEVLQERLCGESSNLRVVPIVGMGGIGKTTLAKIVYDHPLIKIHFDIRAWVTVSQDYSAQRFRIILLGLADSMGLLQRKMSEDKIDDSEIELRVFRNLKGRRYLIVMDDVWGKGVWDDVRNIFPDDDNGSRILLTTRLSDVATYPDSDSPVHNMRFMYDHQSWDLLKQKVFTSNNCPPELEDVGRKIARSCKGLPLAVVLIAGLCADNTTRASWEKIANTVNSDIGEKSDEKMSILSLSYTHLPHRLRSCFLFLGHFREDARILASTLTKLWVAEGFVKHQSGCGRSLEDEAEAYLEDLVKRNLVLVTWRNRNGKIKNCSLHDTVRELCIRTAREEKFLHDMEKLLHDMDGSVIPQSMINEPCLHIRTILASQPGSFPLRFLGRFRLLRVLDAVGDSDGDQEIPSQVFELFHLRYLALDLFKIPSAISNLVNLQTLIIRSTFKNWGAHLTLQLEIWRMPRLRHLVLYGLFYMLPHLPDGSNLPLQHLQTLSPVKNLVWDLKIVHMIQNVKRLRLVYTCNQEYYLHYLNYLLQLEKLKTTGSGDFSWRGKNPSFPCTLKKLTLAGGGFPWEEMGIIIGSLPNLQVLKLLNHACDGETWRTADEEFPQLEYLLIDKSCLRNWTTQSSPLPRLKCLVLRYCEGLAKIPEDIGEIPTLELIEVDNCTSSVGESAKQIEEDQKSEGNDALQVRVMYPDDFHKRISRMKSLKRKSVMRMKVSAGEKKKRKGKQF